MKLIPDCTTGAREVSLRTTRNGCGNMRLSLRVCKRQLKSIFLRTENSAANRLATSKAFIDDTLISNQDHFLAPAESLSSTRKSLVSQMMLSLIVGTLCSLFSITVYADDSATPPSSFTLIIRMTPAACALDPALQKLRQCQDGFTLTISSLQAERVGGKRLENCSRDQTNLSPLQERVVERVMPDKQLRDEDWQRNGSCTGMTPTVYFRTIATYAQRLKIPSELAAPRDTVLTKSHIVSKLQQLNPGFTEKSLLLRCTVESGRELPVLTELRACYNTQGQYDTCPAYIKSNCPSSVVILAAP